MRISDWSSDVCSSDLQREPDREIDHVLHQIISENQIEGVYPEHGGPILRTEPRRKRLVITRPVRPSFQRGTDPALRQNRQAVSQLTTGCARRPIAYSGCTVAGLRSLSQDDTCNEHHVTISCRGM